MRAVCGAGLILALLIPASCGFRPLYGEDSTGGSADMSGVRILAIQDAPDATGRSSVLSARGAQQLRNFLLDRVTPRGQPTPAQYELRVTLAETKSTVLGIRTDETATRATLQVVATFVLTRLDGKGVILVSTARSDVSYNIVNSEFATQAAEDDARRRAMRDLSDTITLRVGNAIGAFAERAAK